MNLLKKSELLLLKQQSLLPAIPMPTPVLASAEKLQKNAVERKESDFIKRLKKTKSIMIAQKNRKQKNVLNPYFMDMRKRKSNDSLNTKSIPTIASSPKSHQTIQEKQQRLERILFPPVHSSIQICLNACKKMRNKELRLQTSQYEAFNIGQYLLNRTKGRNKEKIMGMARQEQGKPESNEKKAEQIETERENLNYTEISENSANGCKSQKKLNSVKQPYYNLKLKRKQLKYYRNFTQQSRPLNENQQLAGWEFRGGDDELEIL